MEDTTVNLEINDFYHPYIDFKIFVTLLDNVLIFIYS